MASLGTQIWRRPHFRQLNHFSFHCFYLFHRIVKASPLSKRDWEVGGQGGIFTRIKRKAFFFLSLSVSLCFGSSYASVILICYLLLPFICARGSGKYSRVVEKLPKQYSINKGRSILSSLLKIFLTMITLFAHNSSCHNLVCMCV